jgi:hypothetical protein
MNAGIANTFVDIAVYNLPQDIVDDGTFSGPADARHADQTTERKTNGDVFQIVVSCLFHSDRAAVRIAANLGDFNLLTPRQEGARETAFAFQNIIDRSFHDHFAAQHTRPGPKSTT